MTESKHPVGNTLGQQSSANDMGSFGKTLTRLIPTKPDTELAEEFKKRLVEETAPLLKLFDEIKDAGFEAGLAWGPGPLGKNVITALKLVKIF